MMTYRPFTERHFWLRRIKREFGRYRGADRQLRKDFPLSFALETSVLRMDHNDPRDPGGFCPLEKKHVMASLIEQHQLKLSVEIGVFRGTSFFPQVVAMKSTGGHAFGIDPYSTAEWKQQQGVEHVAQAYGEDFQTKVDDTNWEELYREVQRRIIENGLSNHCTLIRALSARAAVKIDDGIDMLHIDGNHDYDAVQEDLQHFLPKLRVGGFLVMDDVDWEGVAPHYDELKRNHRLVFERNKWGVIQKC